MKHECFSRPGVIVLATRTQRLRPFRTKFAFVTILALLAYLPGAPSAQGVPDLRAQLDRLAAKVAVLEAKLACVTGAGKDFIFEGCNVHVRNGTGQTGGTPNGLGNLIVGYNEAGANPAPGARSGSHNLVVGPGHSYKSIGGLVAGRNNAVEAPYASVVGGMNNRATGELSHVAGGGGLLPEAGNEAKGQLSSVMGGGKNIAEGKVSQVAGGSQNRAIGDFSKVSGGMNNRATGVAATVGGGGGESETAGNEASGMFASVSGGLSNRAAGSNASIGGGSNIVVTTAAASTSGSLLESIARIEDGQLEGVPGPHLIFEGVNVHVRSGSGSTDDGTIADPTRPLTGLGNLIIGYNERQLEPERGGSHNLVVGSSHTYTSYGGFLAGFGNATLAPHASVSGGSDNIAGERASVAGGVGNAAYGPATSIIGGFRNDANGEGSTICGGSINRTDGILATAVGGTQNQASGLDSSVTGGQKNVASGEASSVSGGKQRTAAGQYNWAAGALFQPN